VDHTDIDNDGDIDFAVTLRRFGACAAMPSSSATHLYINDGTGSFGDPVIFAAPGSQSAHDVLFIDANHDGFADMLIVYEDGTGSRLHLNNADPLNPGFSIAQEFPVGLSAVTADFNGDGIEDFALGNINATIHLNDPASPGMFTQSALHIVGSGSIYDLEAGDIDLDGDIDLVAARISQAANNVALLWLNDGDGALTLAADGLATNLFPEIAGIERLSADLLDVDLDGDLDLYLAGPDGQDAGFGFGKLPNHFYLNQVRGFDIVEPREHTPAYAGNSGQGRRVFLRVRDSGAPPISLADLEATIDSESAPIITGSMIEGEFWALIDAPPRANGCYELFVSRAGAPPSSDREKNSVCYEDDRRFSRAIAIDRTNSMNFNKALGVNTGEKMQAAREATKMFVDLSQAEDQIGIVSFQRDADDGDGVVELSELVERDVDLDFAEVGSTDNRPAIRGVVTLLEPSGPGFAAETSIGAGVIESLNMLQSDGDSDYEHEIVVITDGNENFSPFWLNPGPGGPAEPQVQAAMPQTRVHTIAIGEDANALLLQQMADSTGGRFRNLVEDSGPFTLALAARLTDSLKSIDEHIRIEQRFHYAEGLPEKVGLVPVEPDLSEATLAFYWNDNQALEIFLQSPDGSTVTEAIAGVRIEKDDQHLIYRIANPLAGDWEYFFKRRQDTEIDFFVAASGLSPIVLRRGPGQLHQYDEGGFDVPVRVLLSDFKAITTADITAMITRPDGSDMQIHLRDEGLETDGGFADGIYGVRYADKMPGVYDVQITARGSSNKGIPFVRYLDYSFVYQIGELPDPPDEPKPGDDKRLTDLLVLPFDRRDIGVSCPNGDESCVTSVKLTVINSGLKAAPASTLQVRSDPDLRQKIEQDTPPLQPGEAFDFQYVSPRGGNCFDPNCTVCAVTDAARLIPEIDEDNNRFCTVNAG